MGRARTGARRFGAGCEFGRHLGEQPGAGEPSRVMDVRWQPGGQRGQQLVAGGAAREPLLGERFEGRAVGGGQRHTGFGAAERGEGGVAGGLRGAGAGVGVGVWEWRIGGGW